MKTQHYFFFLLAWLILNTNNIYGQNKIEKIELNTQTSIGALINKTINQKNKDTKLLNNIRLLSKSATSLFQKIRNDQTINHEADSIFINSLEQSQQALDKLTVDWGSNEDATNIIECIRIDYETKLNSSPLGATAKVITNIEVSVLTKSDNKNVAGYDVFYTYMWDSEKKIKKEYFTNQTNNALRILSPGYYFFWIEKDGVLIQDKPRIEIGNLMLPKEIIIFNL